MAGPTPPEEVLALRRGGLWSCGSFQKAFMLDSVRIPPPTRLRSPRNTSYFNPFLDEVSFSGVSMRTLSSRLGLPIRWDHKHGGFLGGLCGS